MSTLRLGRATKSSGESDSHPPSCRSGQVAWRTLLRRHKSVVRYWCRWSPTSFFAGRAAGRSRIGLLFISGETKRRRFGGRKKTRRRSSRASSFRLFSFLTLSQSAIASVSSEARVRRFTASKLARFGRPGKTRLRR